MSENNRSFWLVVLCFIIVYLVWGSTYLANAWGVKVVPPFLFAGVRFLMAGIILLAITHFWSPIKVTSKQLKNTAFAGFLLFAVGNGLVVWALQYVDSGITALVIASEPLIVALLLWKIKNKKPIALTWIGIFMGIVGMVILVGQPNFSSSLEVLKGIGAIFIAMIAWGYVSVWLPEADLPKNLFQSASLQMIFGGAMMLLLSFFFGEYSQFDWSLVDSKVIGAFWYLLFFGSIVAFSAFNYLLKNVSPTKVVTSSYVHPVVALFLGWRLNEEIIESQSLVAAAILLISVFFINKAKAH